MGLEGVILGALIEKRAGLTSDPLLKLKRLSPILKRL